MKFEGWSSVRTSAPSRPVNRDEIAIDSLAPRGYTV
jgi:hypothetical protein